MARTATSVTPLPGAIKDAFDRINGGITAHSGRTSGATSVEGTLIETEGSNKHQGRDLLSRGVYAGWPAMTPKYARHRKHRHHENPGTMARMYVRVPGDSKDYKRVIKGFAETETQEIARKLMGDGDGGYGGLGYVDFLLQQAGHSLAEKFQVVETLSDNYVSFFFGQQAPMFNYSGTLLNSYQDDWAMRMYRLYRDIGRGSQLARRGLLFYLRYDSMIVSGALTAFNFSLNAEMEVAVPFTLQLLVKKVHILYSGLTLPTEVPSGDKFLPNKDKFIETIYTNTTPKVDTPSGDPTTGGTVPTQGPVGVTTLDELDVITEDEIEEGI